MDSHCGARLSGGRGRCHARPVKGRRRCRFHGGLSTGPKTALGMQRTISAMVAGRRRWLVRMQEAKARGIIDKIPTGQRRPGVRKAPTKAVARARGIASRVLATCPETTKPADTMSVAELSAEVFRLSLIKLRQTLDLPGESEDEITRMQARVALELERLYSPSM